MTTRPSPSKCGSSGAGPVVDDVAVAAGGVGLPHLDQRVGHRAAVAVEHPAVDQDPLAHGLAAVAQGQVGVLGRDPVLAEHRPGDLGEPVRQVDRRPQRRAQRRAPVVGVADGVRISAGSRRYRGRCSPLGDVVPVMPGRYGRRATLPKPELPLDGKGARMAGRSTAPRGGR